MADNDDNSLKDFGKALLAVGAVIAGGAVLKEILAKRHPCPRCRIMVKEFAQRCHNCGQEIVWVRNDLRG